MDNAGSKAALKTNPHRSHTAKRKSARRIWQAAFCSLTSRFWPTGTPSRERKIGVSSLSHIGQIVFTFIPAFPSSTNQSSSPARSPDHSAEPNLLPDGAESHLRQAEVPRHQRLERRRDGSNRAARVSHQFD